MLRRSASPLFGEASPSDLLELAGRFASPSDLWSAAAGRRRSTGLLLDPRSGHGRHVPDGRRRSRLRVDAHRGVRLAFPWRGGRASGLLARRAGALGPPSFPPNTRPLPRRLCHHRPPSPDPPRLCASRRASPPSQRRRAPCSVCPWRRCLRWSSSARPFDVCYANAEGSSGWPVASLPSSAQRGGSRGWSPGRSRNVKGGAPSQKRCGGVTMLARHRGGGRHAQTQEESITCTCLLRDGTQSSPYTVVTYH